MDDGKSADGCSTSSSDAARKMESQIGNFHPQFAPSVDLNYNSVLKSMKQESMLPSSVNAGTNVPSDEFIFSSSMKNLYFPPTASSGTEVEKIPDKEIKFSS